MITIMDMGNRMYTSGRGVKEAREDPLGLGKHINVDANMGSLYVIKGRL